MPNTAPIRPDAEPDEAENVPADANSSSKETLGDGEEQRPAQQFDSASPLHFPALAQFWKQLQERWRVFLTDQVTPVRLASHLALLLVVQMLAI